MLAPSSGAATALHVLVLLCCFCVQWSQGFIVTTRLRDHSHKTVSTSTEASHGRDSGGAWKHATGFRRRPLPARGFFVKAGQEGGGSTEEEEEDDTLEVTKGFYSEIAARLGKTAKEGASEVEEDSKESESDKDGEGVTEFDKAIYDELRARRDFGFEQDLGLELEKRNITKEAEVANIVDAGLEQIPGVSSSTTLFPNSELTPREVVTKVLEALKNNDHPYHNHGVEVFVRFLSPSSAMHGIEMAGVARYLAENRNRAFMHWDAIAYPRPLTLSGGAKQNKAFQPLKLKDTMTGSWHSVSVYLTLDSRSNCWLIESCIVKGEL